MDFTCAQEDWPLHEPFVISRETITSLPLVALQIEADGYRGYGEAVGVDYRGETPETIAREVTAYLSQFDAAPPTRQQLIVDLRAGGARNAIDCALWDWEAKRHGTAAWAMADLGPTKAMTTCYTLSLAAPGDMAEAAQQAPTGAPLKLKIGKDSALDQARVQAVRAAMPGARLIVDVNEGWDLASLNHLAPALHQLDVELIEQPLPAGQDHQLSAYCGAVPLCADESFDDINSLEHMAPYDCVNIKLDKAGGLTAALEAARGAHDHGLDVFVGCMLGTSLGMAPAFLLGQLCKYVDLDGPLLLSRDRNPAILYEGALMRPFGPDVWG